MRGVLVVLSLSVFERELERCTEGDVWATAQLASSAALDRALASPDKKGGGGTLYVVTVRPSGRIWLLAVLADVKKKRDAWCAEANRAPITEINALLSRMRFANGARVSAKVIAAMKGARVLSKASTAVLDALVPAASAPERSARAAPKEALVPGDTTLEVASPARLVAALRADLADDSLPLERDACALLHPDDAPMLTKDEVWVVRPFAPLDAGARRFHGFLPAGWPKTASMAPGDDNPERDDFFHGYVMGRFVRYLAWAHLELPGGDAARTGAARVGVLLRERLANPELLILAGIVDLASFHAVDEDDPTAVDADTIARAFIGTLGPFLGEAYAAADGGASADGFDRGDVVTTWPEDDQNGLFVSFRPSRLADDAAFERFLRDVGAHERFVASQGATVCPIRFGDLKVIAPASFAHWITWRAPGFQRLVDALAAPLAEGRFSADPRVSAPDVVADVRARLDLDEAAATLYLQRRALPDASPERLMRYDGWTRDEHDAALRTLAARSLDAIDPVEKRRLHGLRAEDEPVFGVLLPLRPLAEIFADAWRGVP
jgi:hypothetical protein